MDGQKEDGKPTKSEMKLFSDLECKTNAPAEVEFEHKLYLFSWDQRTGRYLRTLLSPKLIKESNVDIIGFQSEQNEARLMRIREDIKQGKQEEG